MIKVNLTIMRCLIFPNFAKNLIYEITKRTILITAGANGIGLQLVRQLVSSNSIIITGRDVTKLEDVKKQFPKVNIIESDVSNSNDIKKLYAYIESNFPQLNVLINNAGVSRDNLVVSMPFIFFVTFNV